jgi:hypothetical protein
VLRGTNQFAVTPLGVRKQNGPTRPLLLRFARFSTLFMHNTCTITIRGLGLERDSASVWRMSLTKQAALLQGMDSFGNEAVNMLAVSTVQPHGVATLQSKKPGYL